MPEPFALDRYIIGDCLKALRRVPDQTFDCCVTSPPYWGLRDYGHPKQFGLEATPGLYVRRLVRFMREVRRTLRDDGTLWLVLGDSYAGSWGAQSRGGPHGSPLSATQIDAAPKDSGTGSLSRTPGLKAKDMVGIPWRVAFALQSDGWWLRKDVIWSKPNPMPESVRDRPTTAHEYVFLLARSERYYYDADAIRETAARPGDEHAVPNRKLAEARVDQNRTDLDRTLVTAESRNARDVWTIPSEPYPGAHFATMPTALAKRCILAGSREGGAVVDPFLGSGTVAQVAQQLGRRWYGCELQGDYAPLIDQRTAQTGLMFADRAANG